MRTRDLQRLTRFQNAKTIKQRKTAKEELLEYRDNCGIPDPTPYEAVKNCIRKERRVATLNKA